MSKIGEHDKVPPPPLDEDGNPIVVEDISNIETSMAPTVEDGSSIETSMAPMGEELMKKL
jgi:hypothetical protein